MKLLWGGQQVLALGLPRRLIHPCQYVIGWVQQNWDIGKSGTLELCLVVSHDWTETIFYCSTISLKMSLSSHFYTCEIVIVVGH